MAREAEPEMSCADEMQAYIQLLIVLMKSDPCRGRHRSQLEAAVNIETNLILAVQHVLALSGMAFSPGAVRDLPELNSESFDPQIRRLCA